MPRKFGQGWQVQGALGVLVVSLGCQGMFGSQGIPADPLFEIKKPVEAKAQTAAPVALAYVEPALPQDPWLAAASRPGPSNASKKPFPGESPHGGGPSGNRPVPGLLTGRPSPDREKEIPNTLPVLPTPAPEVPLPSGKSTP